MMIRIIDERCTGCGICGTVCPEGCITVRNGKAVIDRGFCLTCSRCAAVCPSLALRWEDNEPVKFRPDNLPDAVELDELLHERRTIWEFRGDKVPRALAEEIAAMGSLAPTHNFNFRFVLTDDEAILDAIDARIQKSTTLVYNAFFRSRLLRKLIPALFPGFRHEYLTALPKLEQGMARKRAFDSMPPLWIFVVGDTRVALSNESAQYALYSMDLYAMTKGLGCRNLVGTQMFINGSGKLRSTLGIRKGEKIFATMGVGYPAMKFRNRVEGKSMTVSWAGRQGAAPVEASSS